MQPFLMFALLAPIAVAIALPAVCDLFLWIRGLGRAIDPPQATPQYAPLLFLVPAHNEEMLIGRTVCSLLAQDYPADRLHVVVIADNCTDRTADVATEAGGTVLIRHSDSDRGKHHAIGWALTRLDGTDFDAVVIIDADTTVEPDYATHISRWPDLRRIALQTYDSLSNESDTPLTRLAGLLTRIRYDIVLPLKARAGLSVPMTGDGIVLGREVLARHPWRIQTITEGWELYARFSLAGMRVDYEPRARLYAEETSSLNQSGSQRERWTAGRLHVLRLYWRRILFQSGIRPLQRLDLLAELMSVGPVPRSVLALAGTAACLLSGSGIVQLLSWLFLTGLFQPALYSMVVLSRQREPWPTIRAFGFLPQYAVWRSWLLLRSAATSTSGLWVRTRRGVEPPGTGRS